MTASLADDLVLGAYSLFIGVPDAELVDAYRRLEPLDGIGALEIPLDEAIGRAGGVGGMRKGLPGVVADAWDVVITCMPTVMRRIGENPTYGLASTEEDGRTAAVADVSRALGVARNAAQRSGRRRVRAVEIHSAPRREGASRAALERSLAELLDVESAGAVLAIEHCDAPRPGRSPEKGFLTIDEELAVVEALDDERLGLSVNWGRSAIEGRSTVTPLRHAALAARSGRLAGLMFSGASDVAGTWGAPWADGHIAPRGAGAAPDAWRESLLGADEIAATIAAAAGADRAFLGVKVTAGPAGTALADRIAVARRSVELVGQAANRVRTAGQAQPPDRA